MKVHGLILILLLFQFLCISEVQAAEDSFRWLSVSFRTDVLAMSGGRRMKGDWGWEFGGILASSYSTHTYPCPHSSYTIIAEDDLIGGMGIDVLKFIDLGKNSLFAGAGLYWFQYQIVARSHATGQLYRQSIFNRFKPTYSAGSKFRITDKWELGVGYHSERGINGQVAYNFKR